MLLELTSRAAAAAAAGGRCHAQQLSEQRLVLLVSAAQTKAGTHA